jgi:protein-L-isoaspartate(D-aspartate) O-methyltransferase
MNTEQIRFNMIEQQIRPWNVLEKNVLDLLTVVKREAFVPAEHQNLAFFDTEIPLPEGELMFAPKVEARILQEVAAKEGDKVLEIGAGSGYMAALLAHQAKHVTTVEINPTLRALAEKNLAAYGITNVDVVLGDGSEGWHDSDNTTQYDVIVVSGALPSVPETLLNQLAVGGRLGIIVGDEPVMSFQVITRVDEKTYETRAVFELLVKPLVTRKTTSQFTF